MAVLFVEWGFPMSRFVKQNDGSILDHQTGLVWMNGNSQDLTWAENRCRTLNMGTHQGEWRTPSIEELQELNKADLAKSPFVNLIGKLIWTRDLEAQSGTAASIRLGGEKTPLLISILSSKNMRGLAVKVSLEPLEH